MSLSFHREAVYGFLLSLLLVLLHSAASAQTPAPTAFSYQGFLQYAGSPADGSFDFRFTLHNAAGGGNQVGPVESRTLAVQSGVFSTALDFGAVFDRALWMNVEVRPAGDGAFTALTPRTALASVPYANSVSGGILSGNVVNAETQFSFGGQRLLRVSGTNDPSLSSLFLGWRAGENMDPAVASNLFIGHGAGEENITGRENTFLGVLAGQKNLAQFNAFVGTFAGQYNTTGGFNAFFGSSAGRFNTEGTHNSFFGTGAGKNNTTGVFNSFFGAGTGDLNTTGRYNAFFGAWAGRMNTTGNHNAFFGPEAGRDNTTGSANAFYGAYAGQQNTGGINNSFFGTGAGREATGSHNSFFGSSAGQYATSTYNAVFGTEAGLLLTSGSSNSFFGFRSGLNVTTGDNNAFFGQNAGHQTTTGERNTFIGQSAGLWTTTGIQNTFLGSHAGQNTTDDYNVTGSANTFIGYRAGPAAESLTNATALGANARVSQSNSLVLGNNANVGIGTSAPGSRLTVAGVIESTTGGIMFPDGTVQTTAGGGGGVNAILNQTTPQAGANFNISGTGVASVFDAASHFSIFGEHILSTRTDLQSLYIGNQTGINATGQNNTFVGIRAGFSMTTGQNNTFFGRRAGHDNTSGGSNVYFGDSAGEYNTGGHSNVAVGGHSGQFNQGSFNAFVGWGAGSNNVGGSSNSALGYEANFDAPNLQFATAIGAGAMVASSNTVVLGRPGDNVEVPGTLIKSAGSFRIDHPLDPANKYLSHSFVESPDMMNVYNGNIMLDASGEAWIELPAYFEALNREFRYQLTAIGVPGPNLYVADEIAGNRFRIAGGTAGMKVSWQVTGIRKDPYAERNPIIVEQDKPEAERGRTTTFLRR